jgi:HlyD family secretion protein
VLALVVWSLRGRASPVDIGRVRRGEVREFVEEEARTRCVDRYVVSSPVAGRLLRLEVLEDELVEAGDVVARIDPLAPRSRVEAAKAKLRELGARLAGVDRRRPKPEELKRAELLENVARESLVVAEKELSEASAARAKAESDRDRARRLREGGTITPDELETTELTLTRARDTESARERVVRIRRLEVEVAALDRSILEESARDLDWEEKAYGHQLEAVTAELRALEDDLGRTVLRAPAAGRVLRRHRESEAVVAAGEPVLEIGDVSRLEVEADVLSEDAARMSAGQPVEVFGRALLGRVVEGRIERIHRGAFKKISSLGVEQQRVTIVASFEPGEASLGDGYRVSLRVIFEARKAAVLVPEGALFRRGGRWAAFRVENGRARLAQVVTGLGDGREREVLEGLSEGDEVILHPPNGLEDGDRVTPRC